MKSTEKSLSKKPFLAVLLILCVSVFCGIYFYCISYTEGTMIYIPIMEIYIFFAAALVCAAVVINMIIAGKLRNAEASGISKNDAISDGTVVKLKKNVKILLFFAICLIVPLFADFIGILLS